MPDHLDLRPFFRKVERDGEGRAIHVKGHCYHCDREHEWDGPKVSSCMGVGAVHHGIELVAEPSTEGRSLKEWLRVKFNLNRLPERLTYFPLHEGGFRYE